MKKQPNITGSSTNMSSHSMSIAIMKNCFLTISHCAFIHHNMNYLLHNCPLSGCTLYFHSQVLCCDIYNCYYRKGKTLNPRYLFNLYFFRFNLGVQKLIKYISWAFTLLKVSLIFDNWQLPKKQSWRQFSYTSLNIFSCVCIAFSHFSNDLFNIVATHIRDVVDIEQVQTDCQYSISLRRKDVPLSDITL